MRIPAPTFWFAAMAAGGLLLPNCLWAGEPLVDRPAPLVRDVALHYPATLNGMVVDAAG